MNCAAKNPIKNKQPQKSIIALALLLCFISVSFSSVLFYIIHYNHNCAGTVTECRVCVIINNTKNLLRQIGRTVTSVFFVGASLLTFVIFVRLDEVRIFPATPLKYKVRLNT